jgi:hypothetical protein
MKARSARRSRQAVTRSTAPAPASISTPASPTAYVADHDPNLGLLVE